MSNCKVHTNCNGKDVDCKSAFDLTQSKDLCFIDNAVRESLDIAGAQINVFKLLGVHEQEKLVDQTGFGQPISSGNPQAFPAINAFTTTSDEWRSLQRGPAVIEKAYIGYDFGEIKLDNGRVRYGIETAVRKHVTTIIIKQGDNANSRITKARIENSEDGITWKGAGIVELADTAVEQTLSFKASAQYRYWRLRPLEFNGGSTDSWVVDRLQLIFYNETNIETLDDDPIFLESRNRDYATEAIQLKGQYDLIDVQTEVTKFGLGMPMQQLYIQMNFSAAVDLLGRPILVGDIFEMPSETQYDSNMNPVKKYMEVTDVGWSTEGYAPGWTPTMQRIIVQPAIARQETQDIFGAFRTKKIQDFISDDRTPYQDLSKVQERIVSAAATDVPERGADTADVAEIPQEVIDSNLTATGTDLGVLNVDQTGLYVEDALPPNGEDFTEGDVLPSTPSDGAYHRLTYTGLAADVPPRLFRWSAAKNRWIYLETDRRFEFNEIKPNLQKFMQNGTSLKDI